MFCILNWVENEQDPKILTAKHPLYDNITFIIRPTSNENEYVLQNTGRDMMYHHNRLYLLHTLDGLVHQQLAEIAFYQSPNLVEPNREAIVKKAGEILQPDIPEIVGE
jgi:hypothetical protein